MVSDGKAARGENVGPIVKHEAKGVRKVGRRHLYRERPFCVIWSRFVGVQDAGKAGSFG